MNAKEEKLKLQDKLWPLFHRSDSDFLESFRTDCRGLWWTIHHCAGKKDTSTETLLVFIYLLGNQSSPSGNGLCT